MKKEKVRIAVLDYSTGNVFVSTFDCSSNSEAIEIELSKRYCLENIHWMALGEDSKVLIGADTA